MSIPCRREIGIVVNRFCPVDSTGSVAGLDGIKSSLTPNLCRYNFDIKGTIQVKIHKNESLDKKHGREPFSIPFENPANRLRRKE
jgi:hypothetical protein